MYKKILKNNKKTQKYLNKLPKMYLVGHWAHWGIREFPFTGKFEFDKYIEDYVPLVYDYYDCNGTEDLYLLHKLTDTTTGFVFSWTASKSKAEHLVKILEIYDKRNIYDNPKGEA